LHIRVVAPRIVTVIPGRLWRRLDRYLGGWRDDDWRVGIGLAIGIGIRCPEWSPERSNPNGDTWAAKPVEASMKASKPMSSPGIARPRACREQRRQHHDHPHPLRLLAPCLVRIAHRDHPLVSPCAYPVRWHIPRPGERHQGDAGRVDHDHQPISQGASPDVFSQCTHDFPDVTTTTPMCVPYEAGRQTRSLYKCGLRPQPQPAGDS
jgi:hypothetical protein